MVVPHDPRTPQVTVPDLEQALEALHSQEITTLEDLANQLEAEHEILSRVLQGEKP